ncbi:unnamed protein product [Linum tenue]|nr:unnamed protein product [Linum tenue]
MDDPNVFAMIHASDSRWNLPTAVGHPAAFKALEVCGVTIGGEKLKELAKDLTLTDPSTGQTFHLIVNRQGLCFVYVASQPIVRLRINDHFGWSKYGVKPRISTIWSVWDMSNGAVLVAPPTEDDAADGGDKYSALNESWKKVVEEKEKVREEKESLLRKSLAEKEREVIALKAVVKALSSDE